jgi:diphthamide synthase subunit DPH2
MKIPKERYMDIHLQNTKLTNYSLYAGTSYGGGKIRDDKVIRVSDFILLHGNNVDTPDDLAKMVTMVRKNKNYTTKPILFNEDDNYYFDKPWNNYIAAISEYASWGFF